MQINSNMNINYNAITNSNNEKLKASNQDNVKEQLENFQDNLKKQAANLLKDVAQDECGTYDPTITHKILLTMNKSDNPELYDIIDGEFVEGMLYYGMSKEEREAWIEHSKSVGAEEVVKVVNSLHPAFFNDNDDLKALKKLDALQTDTKANNIYNQAFIKNDSKLLEFLKQNEIVGIRFATNDTKFGDTSVPEFYLSRFDKGNIKLGDVFCGSGGFMDRLMDLFALDDINKFKDGYLALKKEVDGQLKQNDLAKQATEKMQNSQEKEEEQKPFKTIEAKSTNVRESMQDILKKIDINKIKDERELLIILLAYKNSENLYDKRV
ncbi:hypothetical protein [Campylobacter canadensis]|uniref:hypothetical protein n=4 Tax=Campylobacter canadensis TaxID=449520 RepID=UPI001554E259|nr:hypothetical protein [Campylobacter canadensis]MBZ8004599.1 hypothetical protein [Campylobacter canadensis]